MSDWKRGCRSCSTAACRWLLPYFLLSIPGLPAPPVDTLKLYLCMGLWGFLPDLLLDLFICQTSFLLRWNASCWSCLDLVDTLLNSPLWGSERIQLQRQTSACQDSSWERCGVVPSEVAEVQDHPNLANAHTHKKMPYKCDGDEGYGSWSQQLQH